MNRVGVRRRDRAVVGGGVGARGRARRSTGRVRRRGSVPCVRPGFGRRLGARTAGGPRVRADDRCERGARRARLGEPALPASVHRCARHRRARGDHRRWVLAPANIAARSGAALGEHPARTGQRRDPRPFGSRAPRPPRPVPRVPRWRVRDPHLRSRRRTRARDRRGPVHARGGLALSRRRHRVAHDRERVGGVPARGARPHRQAAGRRRARDPDRRRGRGVPRRARRHPARLVPLPGHRSRAPAPAREQARPVRGLSRPRHPDAERLLPDVDGGDRRVRGDRDLPDRREERRSLRAAPAARRREHHGRAHAGGAARARVDVPRPDHRDVPGVPAARRGGRLDLPHLLRRVVARARSVHGREAARRGPRTRASRPTRASCPTRSSRRCRCGSVARSDTAASSTSTGATTVATGSTSSSTSTRAWARSSSSSRPTTASTCSARCTSTSLAAPCRSHRPVSARGSASSTSTFPPGSPTGAGSRPRPKAPSSALVPNVRGARSTIRCRSSRCSCGSRAR